ncbi:MAG: MotA/TolQ/ExbB proton channel family protein [Armatimonadetes bacterium]|nr:MotA/TolQ/ExbB proton channel family protein [Armatimonadota bacterium]
MIERGGIAMYPLLFCSVLVLGLTLERAGVIGRARVNAADLVARLREALERGDREEARRVCAGATLPLGPVALAGLARIGRGREEIDEAMARASALALEDLESNLPVLGTIGGTAPFIGLFGTVLGIMRAFHDIQARGQAGTAVVAGGVSEALIATATGLLVAVLAVISYNVFLNRVGRLEVRLEAARSELLHLFMEDWKWRRDRSAVHAESA